jgi:hypothetical protein
VETAFDPASEVKASPAASHVLEGLRAEVESMRVHLIIYGRVAARFTLAYLVPRRRRTARVTHKFGLNTFGGGPAPDATVESRGDSVEGLAQHPVPCYRPHPPRRHTMSFSGVEAIWKRTRLRVYRAGGRRLPKLIIPGSMVST